MVYAMMFTSCIVIAIFFVSEKYTGVRPLTHSADHNLQRLASSSFKKPAPPGLTDRHQCGLALSAAHLVKRKQAPFASSVCW